MQAVIRPDWYIQNFNRLKTTLQSYSNLYLALSAGVDSQVLLDWLDHFKAELPPIEVLHVNHLLHGEYSYIWADFAKQKAESYGFEFTNYAIAVDANDPAGVESAGRAARYIKMAQHIDENADPQGKSGLLVAHHQSDQAETLIFRLIRGAGVKGLGAMKLTQSLSFKAPLAEDQVHALDNRTKINPTETQTQPKSCYQINILRPFLNISKTQLIETATQYEIKWMEDHSNQNLVYARNQIRNAILPAMSQYFPHYEKGIAKSAQYLQEAQSLLNEIAEEDGALAIFEGGLILANIKNLSVLRQNNLLRFWLNTFQISLNETQLLEFKKVFMRPKQAPPQACFNIAQQQIRFHKGALTVIAQPQEFKHINLWINTVVPVADLIKANIIDFEYCEDAPPLSWWLEQKLKLQIRRGGERFSPIFRDKSQLLKKILQELNLPHWQREQIYYLEDLSAQIIWVSYVGISKSILDKQHKKGVMPRCLLSE